MKSSRHPADLALLAHARSVVRSAAPLAFLLVMSVVTPAHAYLGEQLMTNLSVWLIAPLGIISIVVALAASMFRPEFVKSAIYVAVICVVIFAIIRAAPSIINLMQQ